MQLNIINESYYKGLIGVLSLLLCYNVFASIWNNSLIGVLPICMQAFLIYLLLTKNTISKMIINVWVIFVFFIGSGFRIVGIGMQFFGSYMQNEANSIAMLTSSKMIESLVFLISGIIIWVLNQNFSELIEDIK